MTAKFYPTLEAMRAAHGDALARAEAGLPPEERERLRSHQADEEMAEVRAELLDLGWKLLRVMHGRIRPRA